MNLKDIAIIIGIAGFISIGIALAVFQGLNCLDVNEEYENNPQLAREKYGFATIEEWAKENDIDHNNCFTQGGFPESP